MDGFTNCKCKPKRFFTVCIGLHFVQSKIYQRVVSPNLKVNLLANNGGSSCSDTMSSPLLLKLDLVLATTNIRASCKPKRIPVCFEK